MAGLGFDPYEALGVSRSATLPEVKAAYKRLAPKMAVDQGGDPKRWAQITAAYNLLKSPEDRAQFDLQQFEGALHTLARANMRPPTVEVLPVPFLVALRGGTLDTSAGRLKIPRGARSSLQIAVHRAEGELRFLVSVEPHPHLQRDESTLSMTLHVTPYEAYRGGPLGLPTPWGPALVRIEPGIVTGQCIKLPGYGVRCRHQPAEGPTHACPCDQGELRAYVIVDPLPAGDPLLAAALERHHQTQVPRADVAASMRTP